MLDISKIFRKSKIYSYFVVGEEKGGGGIS